MKCKKNKKIKVVHVLGKLQIGGAETLVMNLYRNIDRDKVEFSFIVHGNELGDYEREIVVNGDKIFHIPKYTISNLMSYKKALEEIFSSNKFDIVHCHIRSSASIVLKIAKKYNVLTISHSHATSNGSGIKSIIKDIL